MTVIEGRDQGDGGWTAGPLQAARGGEPGDEPSADEGTGTEWATPAGGQMAVCQGAAPHCCLTWPSALMILSP